MPAYVIHVGPHKTGSTYIQRGLYTNSETLKQHGILFPTHWQATAENPNHALLVARLESGDPSLEDELAVIERAGFNKVVLSHEGLSGLSLPALQRLRKALGSNEIKVIFYVRRWTDWMYSAWNEFVVHGSSDTFLEFALPHLADPRGSAFLNIGVGLRDLVAAFGRSSIKIVSFSAVVESRMDPFEHFCRSFLSENLLTSVSQPRANASFNLAELELMRAVQAVGRRSGVQTSSRVVENFRTSRKQIDISELLNTLKTYERPIDLQTTYMYLRPILATHRHDLSDLIVGPVPEGFWYEERPPVITYTSLDYLLLPGMSETLLRLRHFLR